MKKYLWPLLLLTLLLAGCRKAPAAPTAATPATTVSAAPEETPEETPTAWPAPVLAQLSQKPLETPISTTLTPEQTANFASARYVLLQRAGEAAYIPFYFSKDVTLEGNTLSAGFNGKVFFGLNQTDTCAIPYIEELETRDGLTHFCVAVRTNDSESLQEYNLHLLVDRQTGDIQKSRLLLRSEPFGEDVFSGEEPQALFGSPKSFILPHNAPRLLTKSTDGTIAPLQQWKAVTDIASGISWGGDLGLTFVYGRLATLTTVNRMGPEDCRLVFEITDTHGNRYCSEPLPVPVEKAELPENDTTLPVLEMDWEQGNKLTVLEENDIGVYLRKEPAGILNDYLTYRWELRNDTPSPVYLNISALLCNGTVEGSSCFLTVQPGQWQESYDISFNTKGLTDVPEILSTLEFDLSVQKDDLYGKSLLPPQHIRIRLTPETAVQPAYITTHDPICQPCRGAQAGQQLLAEQDGLRITLVALGATEKTPDLNAIILAENNSTETREIKVDSTVLNGQFLSTFANAVLKPGQSQHLFIQLSENSLNNAGIHSIHSLQLGLILHGPYESLYQYHNTPTKWYPVTLTQAAEKTDPTWESAPLLLEEQGLQIRLLEAKTQAYISGGQWTVVITNRTGKDISLSAVDQASAVHPISIYAKLGDGQSLMTNFTGGNANAENPLRLTVLDYHQGEIFFDTSLFTLPAING